jgi:hypothetical protein
VVICRKTIAGQCSGSIGTFVVVNRDGWVVTAGHIVTQLHEMMRQVETVKQFHGDLAAIRADTSIGEPERKKRIKKLPKPANNLTERCAQIWAVGLPQGARPLLRTGMAYQHVDIAVAKLEPWDPAWVSKYPVFKDPTKNFEPGKFLCRIGFPFHAVKPQWNEANDRFDLPGGTFPAPFFPIEGIFTRTAELTPRPGDPPFPFPFKWIETSSPGLKGQSGGPIFDEQGSIWGIQCQTVAYDLGFDTPTKTVQYLNVGVGVHPETLFRVFDAHGVTYQVSNY